MRKLGWLLCLAAACNFGRQQSLTARVALPLSEEDCQRLQRTDLGGAAFEGTFVAVAGAEFPPITYLDREHKPCQGEAPDLVAEIRLEVPEGRKRVVALGIMGPVLELARDLALPEVEILGLPVRLRTPRTVFFGGGKVLDPEDLLRGEIEIAMDPFVNLLGQVARDGAGRRARVSFYRPKMAGPCHQLFDTEEDPALEAIYTVETGPEGRFFATVPYSAPESDVLCSPEDHGNDLLVFAETADGEVALLVPGRARDKGEGIEPGMLLADVRLRPLPRSRIEQALVSVTGIARVPDPAGVKFQISGYNLDQLPLPLERVVQVDPVGSVRLEVFEQLAVGRARQGIATVDLPSYARFRVARNRTPSTLTAKLTTLGGELVQLAPGTYTLTGELAPNLDISFTFRIRP